MCRRTPPDPEAQLLREGPFSRLQVEILRRDETRMTFRKDLIALLSHHPWSASALARELGLRRTDLEEDLRHAIRSARTAGHNVQVLPARCKSCGFEFHEDRLLKPGRCPACKGSRIYEAQVLIGSETTTRFTK